MTTLVLNVRDDNKATDLIRFLRDIDFLDVQVKEAPLVSNPQPPRRTPAKELVGTRIIGDIMQSATSEWDILNESAS